MTIFVSIPTNGLSIEEIYMERDRIVNEVKRFYGLDEAHAVSMKYNTLDAEIRCPDICLLGLELECMGQADLAVFGNNWRENRKCIVEYGVAKLYDIPVLDMDG